jgi:hypothetical protein
MEIDIGMNPEWVNRIVGEKGGDRSMRYYRIALMAHLTKELGTKWVECNDNVWVYLLYPSGYATLEERLERATCKADNGFEGVPQPEFKLVGPGSTLHLELESTLKDSSHAR